VTSNVSSVIHAGSRSATVLDDLFLMYCIQICLGRLFAMLHNRVVRCGGEVLVQRLFELANHPRPWVIDTDKDAAYRQPQIKAEGALDPNCQHVVGYSSFHNLITQPMRKAAIRQAKLIGAERQHARLSNIMAFLPSSLI